MLFHLFVTLEELKASAVESTTKLWIQPATWHMALRVFMHEKAATAFWAPEFVACQIQECFHVNSLIYWERKATLNRADKGQSFLLTLSLKLLETLHVDQMFAGAALDGFVYYVITNSTNNVRVHRTWFDYKILQ